jgi:hypothetical protein
MKISDPNSPSRHPALLQFSSLGQLKICRENQSLSNRQNLARVSWVVGIRNISNTQKLVQWVECPQRSMPESFGRYWPIKKLVALKGEETTQPVQFSVPADGNECLPAQEWTPTEHRKVDDALRGHGSLGPPCLRRRRGSSRACATVGGW